MCIVYVSGFFPPPPSFDCDGDQTQGLTNARLELYH
jgi:hypothetical protein